MAELAKYVPMALQAGGGILSFLGGEQSAAADELAAARKRAAADFTATQLRSRAGQVVAVAQRGAEEELRRARIVQSRGLAVAAASGGGVSDPTVVRMLGRVAGEGAYRAATVLYSGEESARVMRMQADAANYEGEISAQASEAQAKAARLAGGGGLFKSAVSLYSKYGGPNPPGSGSTGLMAGTSSIDEFGINWDNV